MRSNPLRYRLPRLLITAALVIGTGSSQAFTLSFNYTYDGGFFSNGNESRRSIMNDAGSFFEQRINDRLSAITSTDHDHFNANFRRPDSGDNITLNDFNVAADTLVIYAGGRALANNSLGTGGPGGYSISDQTPGFEDTVVNRGQGTTRGPTADDFGPWGGSITFNSTYGSWYFDTDPSTSEPFSGSDFYSVALHEIAHVLGYGTSDSWDNLVTDTGPVFTGSHATSLFAGDVPLTSDGSHWQARQKSTVDGGDLQEVAMGPSLRNGQRKVFTDLDLAGLQDIGWEVVSPVPVPAAVYLFGSGLLGLLGLARRRSA